MFIRLIVIGLIIFSLNSCKKDNNREIEPNNSYNQASKFDLNFPVKGFLNDSKDNDWYVLEVDEPQSYSFSVSAIKGVNHALKFYKLVNSTPEFLKIIDDSRKSSPESIKNFYLDKGTYYIEVVHGDRDKPKGNTEVEYTIQAMKISLDNIEIEPNDDQNSAMKINNGDTIKGYFSPAFNKNNKRKEFPIREEDWFFFEVEASEEAPQIANISLSPVQRVNSILYLYDQEMKLIATSDMGQSGAEEELKGIGLKNSGRYYIVIASKSYEVNTDNFYSLNFTLETYDSSRELESNNSIKSANKINDNRISGRIFPMNESDYFLYSPESSEEVCTLKIDAVEKVNFKINIYDFENNKVGEFDNGGEGEPEIIPNLFVNSMFYIEVSGSSSAKDKNIDYTLAIEPKSYENGAEKEPNNNKNSATKITSNILYGFTTAKNDEDFYKLDYGKNVQKKIIVTLPENCEVEVSITDQLGYVVTTKEVKSNEPFEFQEMIEKGSFLIVKTIKANYNESYTIKIGE